MPPVRDNIMGLHVFGIFSVRFANIALNLQLASQQPATPPCGQLHAQPFPIQDQQANHTSRGCPAPLLASWALFSFLVHLKNECVIAAISKARGLADCLGRYTFGKYCCFKHGLETWNKNMLQYR